MRNGAPLTVGHFPYGLIRDGDRVDITLSFHVAIRKARGLSVRKAKVVYWCSPHRPVPFAKGSTGGYLSTRPLRGYKQIDGSS